MTSATQSARAAALIEQLKQAAGRFRGVLKDDVDAAHWHFQPTAGTSNIHWLVGHVTETFGSIFPKTLGAASCLPDSLDQQFGMGSKPAAAPGDGILAPAELLASYDKAVAHFTAALAEVTDETLDSPMPDWHPLKEMFPSIYAFLGAGIGFHTAYHTGQVAMLQRIQGIEGAGFGL